MAQINSSSKNMVSIQAPGKANSSGWSSKIVIGILLTLALFVLWTSMIGSGAGQSSSSDASKSSLAHSKDSSAASQITEGTLGSTPYYHCGPGTNVDSSSEIKHIVLLHGARFTKEDWKSSGILDMLCHYNQLSVTAFDLNVKSTYKELVPLLKQLGNTHMATLPIAALVTPSASGLSVVSALRDGQLSQIQALVNLWVPVASGSVQQLTAPQLAAAKNKDFTILAMNGDQDGMGQTVGHKLANEAGAETMEFRGGHPFYLSIPREFTNALVQILDVNH